MSKFSQKLLRWYDKFGRKDLPWQKTQTPYRVWVSEIMLQQTQVATVIPYYQRFMRSFPNLKRLALADQDDVLHLWTGLGYYARARNLHKTAQIIYKEHKGRFPLVVDQLVELPGIGRSTAGAILALSQQQRLPILDGNVKRVFCRMFALEGWPDSPATQKLLWPLAEKLLPKERMRDYTQAIMDLGAMVCTRSTVACEECPMIKDCEAYKTKRVAELPHKKAKIKQPIKSTCMLIIKNNDNDILLEKRPPTGIWGGLWSFPECEISEVVDWCQQQWGIGISHVETMPVIRHTFSHFHLDITPVTVVIQEKDKKVLLNYQLRVMESDNQLWYNNKLEQRLGFAAPVKKLLESV
ncbi:A/G-specific adenine glycosylase [hydrothermal vent metagenome]|uniref:Adenine DNA glycosylase n=1 Tax=hydrothermal vent metagenome TaxID=652676 RepID=A0A3B0YMF0_9ZZZZ